MNEIKHERPRPPPHRHMQSLREQELLGVDTPSHPLRPPLRGETVEEGAVIGHKHTTRTTTTSTGTLILKVILGVILGSGGRGGGGGGRWLGRCSLVLKEGYQQMQQQRRRSGGPLRVTGTTPWT